MEFWTRQNPKWSTTKKWILTSFYELWRKFPLTTKGGATRALGKLKTLKLLFFLTNNDSQQLIIVDMIISKCPTKKVLAMQWDTHEASKCWCSSTSIEQSMSVLQKCLFCSVIARSQSCSWNPMGHKER